LHRARRRQTVPRGDCTKGALPGAQHCSAHGGGKRCKEEDCNKAARGDTGFCIAHGGGRRCQEDDCTKSARGDTGHCKAHGGGRRCQHAGFSKAAATGGTPCCVAHGGGRRCKVEGCSKPVVRAPGAVVCTADSVYRAHRKSSLVKRRRLKLRLGSRTTCESSRRSDGGGELMQRSPQASKREWQTCPCTRVLNHWGQFYPPKPTERASSL
jgi:hypothetical protein